MNNNNTAFLQKHANCIQFDFQSPEILKKRDQEHLEKLAKRKQRGRIELIMGPMFAGKSTELLRRVNK